MWFWAAGIVLGAVQAWSSRYSLSPDSISYLDVGRAYLRGDWHGALNSYWSPLYAILIAAPREWLKLGPRATVEAIHVVNFALYLAALLAFEYLWAELARSLQEAEVNRSALPNRVFWALGYVVFLIATLDLIKISTVTPDLLVCVVVLIAAGMLVRMRNGGAGALAYAALGVLMGLGYLVKAPVLPVGMVFIGAAVWCAAGSRRRAISATVALLGFAFVAAPFIAALSHAKGRLTWGDSGRLNYTWFVSGVPYFRHWQGGPSTMDVAKHPTRRLHENPALYEFATPVAGTYPPWYDPTYWYEGARARIRVLGWAVVIARQTAIYLELLLHEQGPLLAGALALLSFAGLGAGLRRLRSRWELWIPALAALAMYALVHVDGRFVGGFFSMLWAAVLASVRIPTSRDMAKLATRIGVITAASATVLLLVVVSRDAMNSYGYAPPHVLAAEELQKLGVSPGTHVACICDGSGAYWAALAELRVVSEIPESEGASFWAADPATKERLMATFASTGAELLVAPGVPPTARSGWREIGTTAFYYRTLMATPEGK